MLLALKRIIKAGFINFWRNSFVSLASIVVMVITLFTVGSLLFVSAVLESTLEEIRDKVDVNIYFITEAPEPSILAVRDALAGHPAVEQVDYVTRQEALEIFRINNQNDQIALQALDELDDNPFRARLRVKATDPSQYESIANFLTEDDSAVAIGETPIISKIDFNENRIAIERLTEIIRSTEQFGQVVTIVLIVTSILITFNTVRLAIYTARDEISVMRLVGASHAYIRGPFVFEGIMYGVISGIITLVSFYPLTLYLSSAIPEGYFGELNLFAYYTANFGQIFMIIMSAGVALGAISSYLAVKKYLRL